MTNILNTKIILSFATILAAAALVVGATFAYFSDSEVAGDNTFTAGSIDLSLGGDFSSVNNGNFSFGLLADNNGRALYDFEDLKPGDFGQGTFNLEVNDNDAYVCSLSTITSTPENVRLEPEIEAGDNTNGVGELQNYLQLATFADTNNNNVYDLGEAVNVNQYGGDGNGFTFTEIAGAGWIPVADTNSPDTWLTIGNLTAGTEENAGMLYCYGDFVTTGTGSSVQVTGCDGSNADSNVAQTDQIVGSIEFRAIQTRNNPDFDCTTLNQE